MELDLNTLIYMRNKINERIEIINNQKKITNNDKEIMFNQGQEYENVIISILISNEILKIFNNK